MSQYMWSMKDTFELIKCYKANPSLWDSKHWQYKDKKTKRETINNIASAVNTSPEEVVRKLHNLKCQLRQEIKKSKHEKGFKSKILTSSWCYFSAMKFLIPTMTNTCRIRKLMKKEDPEEKNIEEYRNLEEIEERYERIPAKFSNNTYNEESKHSLRFLPKVPNREMNTMEYIEFDGIEERHDKKIPARYVNISYDEEPRHSSRIVPKASDEDDRFGEYVALELRSLRSEVNKRRLKSEIRRAICRIVDFDDANILIPGAPVDPLPQYLPSSPKYSQICEITDVKSESI